MAAKSDVAVAKFMDGYNCAQSVFYAFCDDLGFDKNIALKIACGFGAGMGRKEEVCGAVTGAILVLGAKHGKGENGDSAATECTYKKTVDLMDMFTKRHGSYICRKILDGCDLATPEGQALFKEKNMKKEICTPCVKSVCEILETVL